MQTQIRVTLWALESDYDKETVGEIGKKVLAHYKIDRCAIRTVGKTAIPKRSNSKESDPLTLATLNYLKQDDFVIFILDSDGPISSKQRQQEPNSLINQVTRLLQDKRFNGKLFLVQAVQEIESWLLVDCLGIFHHFASTYKQYKLKTRQEIEEVSRFITVIQKYQLGDTELMVEAQMGGDGAKEYLERFSEAILRCLNPDMPEKNVKSIRYSESMSPKLAKVIELNGETMARNSSLVRFGRLFQKMALPG